MRTLALLALVLGLAGPSAAAEDLPSLFTNMETAYARVSAYSARFTRQERVRDVLRPREEVLLKFQRPGRIALRLRSPHLFVEPALLLGGLLFGLHLGQSRRVGP